MNQQKLIAEIGDNEIKYVVYEKNDKSEYKILKKKVSENTGIIKGKILDFNYTAEKINNDLKNLEKDHDKIFSNISILINEPEILCTNLSGFKRLNGSKVEKRDIDYILNEAKSSILKNQKKNSILHIINSNFILDKIKKNKIPLDLHGDHLSLHITFISLPTNNLKNIKSLFNNSDLKIERVISKPLALGIDLLNKNKVSKNFLSINLDKEITSVSLYEGSSLVFLKIFPFGTNSIYRDISQLCSLKENEIKNIIAKINLQGNNEKENKYIQKDFFSESQFKKLSICHLFNITKARTIEILDYVYYKNINLNYANHKISKVHLFFEDENIMDNLGKLFQESLKVDQSKTQIELSKLNDYSALSGAAELIFKGWDKEAIPMSSRNKSIISGFFERFF